MEISFGKPDDTWQQYGLVEFPINYNQQTSKYKALTRNGDLISFVGSGYQLIPNEEAVKIADRAAKLSGLVPFTEFTGDWCGTMEKHVILDKHGNRCHALYASNETYEVEGEKMHLGVGVHNSIDGSTAFGCGVFTFRKACANLVLAGTKGFTEKFTQTSTLEYLYKRHTASLDPAEADLKNAILRVMQRVPEILAAYNQMAQIKATEALVEKLKESRLSKKVLPDYITEDEAKVPDISNWEVYNDITEAIWHNAKSGLRTKTFQFDALHRIMPLQVRRV